MLASGFVSIEQSAGLNGPVIINGAGTSGTWNGDVRVGPLGGQTTLATRPYYSDLSAGIGGGSVGSRRSTCTTSTARPRSPGRSRLAPC